MLPTLSDAISQIAIAAAPWLVAIRVAPNQHVTGTLWDAASVLTIDRLLPSQASYTVAMAGGITVTARVVGRDPSLDLALLRLDRAAAVPPMRFGASALVGSLTIVAGADFDATPTARLTAIHRQAREAGPGAVLDMADSRAEPGGLVLNAAGMVLGISHTITGGLVTIVSHRDIGRFLSDAAGTAPASLAATERPPAPVGARPATPPPVSRPRPPAVSGAERRGWFGIALQPITVPEPLVSRAGQTSGRLVVGITAGGPAEAAGLRVGDVLLSLDGRSTSGAHSLRAFLEGSRIGSQVETRILRDTVLATVWLTVAEQP